MKKYFGFFAALCILSAGLLAPQGLSAQQKRVVKVQGHPHELLTQKAAEGTAQRKAVSAPADTAYIDPGLVPCWIDAPRLRTDTETDSAYLVIKFTDGKGIDSLFIWGYRWNPYQVYYDPETGERDSSFVQYHGIDMLRTVANNDRRLTVMLQYTGKSGHAVGGIGLKWEDEGIVCSRVELAFDMESAKADPAVKFAYSGTPDCADGQVAVPFIDENLRVSQAASESKNTGILKHPFGAEYGYPAYDYDYWSDKNEPDVHHWQAGWNRNGFWGYYRADNRRVPIPGADFNNDPDAAQFGVTYEPLQNQQVQGFVFEPAFVVHQFDGTPRYMDCRCAPCAEENKGGNKR